MTSTHKNNRQQIYRLSLFFSIIYFILIYFQKRLLIQLFQTQLSFSIPDTLAVLTSDNSLDTLIERATNGGILVGVFLIVEVLIFIGLISYLLFKIWRMHQLKHWQKIDWFLVVGLCLLFLSSLYYTYVTANSTLTTFNEIEGILKKLTPSQIKQLSSQWRDMIIHYEFSLGHLPRDITFILEKVDAIISSIKDVGRIPNLTNQWLNHLTLLKTHYFLTMCVGFLLTFVGQLFNYRVNGPLFQTGRKNARRVKELESTVISLNEENQELNTQLIELKEKLTKKNVAAIKKQNKNNKKKN
ncbi:MAG: hypothetical protein RR554_10250 [Vagococcus sp.]|uniref:hypothetical protein n=1 Tax=Vagococcus sp. TaxID=1933889 RepID=UPI002FC731A9